MQDHLWHAVWMQSRHYHLLMVKMLCTLWRNWDGKEADRHCARKTGNVIEVFWYSYWDWKQIPEVSTCATATSRGGYGSRDLKSSRIKKRKPTPWSQFPLKPLLLYDSQACTLLTAAFVACGLKAKWMAAANAPPRRGPAHMTQRSCRHQLKKTCYLTPTK